MYIIKITLMKKIVLFLFIAIQSIAYSQFTSTTGLIYLPDGSGINYTDTIIVSGFNAGALFSSISDLESLKVNIEHSYLGDLEMLLTCPNGTSVTVFNSNSGGIIPGGFSGGGTYLGHPINDQAGPPGVGEDYIWSSTSNTFGDFPTEFAAVNIIALTTPSSPSAGNSMNWNGIYAPEESFINLIGCPLNGDWYITIRDNLGTDDGYVFGWGLDFDTLTNPVLSVSAIFTNTTCGQCNGTATATTTNNIGPVNYLWNTVPAQTTPTVVGLCPGTYTVSATELNTGNVVFNSVTITDIAAPIIDSIITTNDNGSCNGSANAFISSTIAYTVSWTPSSQTTNSITNLCDGQYCITVTDANGCTSSACDSIDLISPTTSLTTTSASCGLCNGAAEVSILNGNPPYSYLWNTNPAQLTQTASGLCSGTYIVSAIDGLGNTFVDSVTVAEIPVAIIDSIITTSTTDNVSCDGSATAFITSPIPYTISWNPSSQTTNSVNNLCDGQYCITLTDSNGCVTDSCETVLITGINDLGSSFFSIYPNPVLNEITVSLKQASSGQLEISNSLGQLVSTKTFINIKNIKTTIDGPAGIYFLQLKIGNQLTTKKLVKE